MTFLITGLAIQDWFYNWPVVLGALFVLAFILYFYVLSKTNLGKGDNRSVAVVISFVLAILTVYGLAVKKLGFSLFNLPQFDFLRLYFPNFYYFLSDFEILGIIIILAALGVLYALAKAFFRYLKINLGW